MSESVLDQILAELRKAATIAYAGRGEVKNLRVVGHTPKNDHFIYDICVDLSAGSERVAAKIYRANNCNGTAKGVARLENSNTHFVHTALVQHNLATTPHPAAA